MPNPPGEPSILVNGVQLTEVQAAAVRYAVTALRVALQAKEPRQRALGPVAESVAESVDAQLAAVELLMTSSTLEVRAANILAALNAMEIGTSTDIEGVRVRRAGPVSYAIKLAGGERRGDVAMTARTIAKEASLYDR